VEKIIVLTKWPDGRFQAIGALEDREEAGEMLRAAWQALDDLHRPKPAPKIEPVLEAEKPPE
jgi:hypothetical protein